MRIALKKALIKTAIFLLLVATFGLFFSTTNSVKVGASQEPFFYLENGAYIREVNQNFADKKAMRFIASVNETWVEQNLSGVDYTFYTKVTANGKTAYRTWLPDFDQEDGVYNHKIDLANLPSSTVVENIYSEEFAVSVGVSTVADLKDGVADNPVQELDAVTRTMEYVAARAAIDGHENVSVYFGGGNAYANYKENVVEIEGVNTSPYNLVDFEGIEESSVKTVYVDGIKQKDASFVYASTQGLEFYENTLTKGGEYTILAITDAGEALYANYIMPVDFAISDVDSYLEWYNAGTSVKLNYYAALTNNVYLTEDQDIGRNEWQMLPNGTLNGRGYLLDGLSSSCTGIWKDIGTFTFKNIGLTNMLATGAGASYSALFAYNDAVKLSFDNVWLTYSNTKSISTKGRVGFTSYSSASTDVNVHFYNSVIVANQPNANLPLFKHGVVGTLSNTKTISLNNREVTTGVLADYTSLEEYYSNSKMNTKGYDMSVWTVVDGVLMFKQALTDVTLAERTLGKNLLEDEISVAISSDVYLDNVLLNGTEVDYTLENNVITVNGFSSLATGKYSVQLVVSVGLKTATLTVPVSVVENKTATDSHYNEYLILDGVTKHTLVVPSSTDTYSSQAITDFKALFKEATGLTLNSITDSSSITYNENSRYIVLGGTNVYNKAGLVVDESVKDDGYQIVTQGQSIFILGKTTRGRLFGAYELLSKLFDYERFTPNTYIINKSVKHVQLPLYDFIDNPDVDLRIGGWGSVYYNDTEANALTMRFDMNYKDLWIEDNVYGANWTHNMAEIMDYVGHIPSDLSKVTDAWGRTPSYNLSNDSLVKQNGLYYHNSTGGQSYGYKVGWFFVAAHKNDIASYGNPLTYTSNKVDGVNKFVQLCYSGGAGYNQPSNGVWEEMVEFGATRVANIINADTTGNKIFQMTAEDNANVCQCTACKSWYDHYCQGELYLNYYANQYNVIRTAGFMGLQLRFINAVARYITDNDLLDADKKDVKIATFCYSGYTDAPCYEDENGNFKPIDDAVVCPDNVLIYFAPSMDYTKTISDATKETNERNYKMMRILKATSVICNHVGAWLYQVGDYDDYFLPENNYYAYGDIYRTFTDMGAKWIFHQGAQKRTDRSPAFAELKLYLNSKLEWDSTLNEQELIDKFFDGYFGPASATMKEMFYSMYDVCDAVGGTSKLSRDVFSQDILEYWIDLCEQALKEIEVLKSTDSTRYNLLVKNIQCEMMTPRYLLIRLYQVYNGSTFTSSNLSTIKTQFIAECKAAGVLTGNNQTTIDSVVLTYVK